MKKLMVSMILAGVIVAAFGFVSTANAQGPVDQPVYGQGGGQGGFGAARADRVENEDVHNLMMEAWSTELGLSVEELETREDAGERLSQIALSTGMALEDFQALKTEIHTAVADQALAAGYIDQAQYDWMIQAANRQMNGRGNGAGMGNGTRMGTGTRAADGTGTGMRRGAGRLGTGLGTGDCLVQP